MELTVGPLPDKDFFNMGETCRITQVPPHTLRYWETHVGFLRPARRTSGHRRYSRTDLETILQIKDLVQSKKMTVAGAKKALLEHKKGPRPEGGPEGEQAAGVPAATLRLLREVRKEIDLIVSELG
ncbi:MAG: MerR family transcriptional regulator [Elusimicrobia bacterium]|nr:MerR family transcriptional regulator [Elusimicrobiota bacterium]